MIFAAVSIQPLLNRCYPAGTETVAVHSYRPGYRDFPARIVLRTPAGTAQHCVVKTGESLEGLLREASVLRALSEVGLPVPAVLAGPLALPEAAATGGAMLLSELPGQPLPWLGPISLAEADLACRLLIGGVNELRRLTEAVSRHAVAATLPRVTLAAEYEEIARQGAAWRAVVPFARALDLLPKALAAAAVPLVFSNGDYNPLNFLHEGETLTGWVDFEGARFEDPHIGLAKFLIWSRDEWGWGTGVKAGMVERYLYALNLSRREFAPRLVLRCLRHLQDEVSPGGQGDAEQRRHILGLLEAGLADLAV